MTAGSDPATATGGADAGAGRDEGLVPGWLALLVMALLVGVVGVGGLIIYRVIVSGEANDPSAVAMARYAAQVRADPADMGARLNLAYSFQQAGRFDDAVEQYDRVLKTRPKDLAALYNQGVIAAARGDVPGAEVWWSKTLAVDPTHVLAAESLGGHLVSEGRYRDLVDAVGPASRANPTLADLQYLLGFAYEKLGDAGRAREHYGAALRYSPQMTEARSGLARVGGGTP
jgi:tetratricopeptide (TPR) repeat protein